MAHREEVDNYLVWEHEQREKELESQFEEDNEDEISDESWD